MTNDNYGLNAPTVRLELMGLKQSVTHALFQGHKQIEAEVDQQLQAQIESFDMAGVVAEILKDTLRAAVHAAMKNAIREATETPEFRERLAEMLRREITWDWEGENDPRRQGGAA